ncbi:conserved exported hypothetical protein [Candidatus Sulfotelmatomonas gaucii]|uniref:TrbI/VirB10 family protein n=1 Tax=Candidatus Sulfuritelmatomonas gaucii TaxID=2043161 RepID=A0A2N9LFJ4_9BACT|nr:conserved exported hypothetical protein [Candidatus Sulfotelmatomonas gaucii]
MGFELTKVISARNKEIGMKRTLLVYALFAGSVAGLAAQQASQQNPYEGTSNPPPDTTITTPEPEQPPIPKPSPSHLANAQPAAPAEAQPAPQIQPSPIIASANSNEPGMADGTDGGIVVVVPETNSRPELNQRTETNDPDGDIVHPAALHPGELGQGAVIRVRLLTGLSTAMSEPGEKFRSRVASDVIQDGQVLIPNGSEIDGTVTDVSSGHFAGHGSMRLHPEMVILPDGSRFRMYAELSAAPGSGLRVDDEGAVTPGSRLKKASLEYGGAVGAGAVTGAIVGGPGGALAGTILGAGVITAHLLINHPQARLESGTYLLFTLNEPLNLVPAAQTGN